MQRRCANCHGRVTLTRLTTQVPNPNPLADGEHDMIDVQGLGTWHCENNCPQRTVNVTTYVGAGKESELRSAGIERVVRDEHLIAIPRRRHIRVEYGAPKKKGATP